MRNPVVAELGLTLPLQSHLVDVEKQVKALSSSQSYHIYPWRNSKIYLRWLEEELIALEDLYGLPD